MESSSSGDGGRVALSYLQCQGVIQYQGRRRCRSFMSRESFAFLVMAATHAWWKQAALCLRASCFLMSPHPLSVPRNGVAGSLLRVVCQIPCSICRRRTRCRGLPVLQSLLQNVFAVLGSISEKRNPGILQSLLQSLQFWVLLVREEILAFWNLYCNLCSFGFSQQEKKASHSATSAAIVAVLGSLGERRKPHILLTFFCSL